MRNGWVKIFQGSYITGADEDSISWSQTNLDGLRGVQVFHNGLKAELIRGLGEYNYSEDYEVPIGSCDHKLLAKRVQFKTSNGWETMEIDIIEGIVHNYTSVEKI